MCPAASRRLTKGSCGSEERLVRVRVRVRVTVRVRVRVRVRVQVQVRVRVVPTRDSTACQSADDGAAATGA